MPSPWRFRQADGECPVKGSRPRMGSPGHAAKQAVVVAFEPRKTASRATIVNVVIASPRRAVERAVPGPGKVAPKATLLPIAPQSRRGSDPTTAPINWAPMYPRVVGKSILPISRKASVTAGLMCAPLTFPTGESAIQAADQDEQCRPYQLREEQRPGDAATVRFLHRRASLRSSPWPPRRTHSGARRSGVGPSVEPRRARTGSACSR
jgi:hypothetical protein